MLQTVTDEQIRRGCEIPVDHRRILDRNISDHGHSLLYRVEHIEERILPATHRVAAGLGNGLIGLLEQFFRGCLQRIGTSLGDLVPFGRFGQQVFCRGGLRCTLALRALISF